MVKTKKESVEIRQQDVFIERHCDFCRKETKSEYDWNDNIDNEYKDTTYYSSNTKIEYSFGERFDSDTDNTKIYKLDMCPTCFHKYVMANLRRKVEPTDLW